MSTKKTPSDYIEVRLNRITDLLIKLQQSIRRDFYVRDQANMKWFKKFDKRLSKLEKKK